MDMDEDKAFDPAHGKTASEGASGAFMVFHPKHSFQAGERRP
jgi:hypothetical protein